MENSAVLGAKIKSAHQEHADGASNVDAKFLGEGLVVYRGRQMSEIANVLDIVKEYHAESRYAHIPFSEKKFTTFCARMKRHPEDTIGLYVQYNGQTVGVLSAGIGEYYLGDGGRMATIYGLYVSQKIRGSFLGGKIGLRLVRMAIDWAKSQKTEEIHIQATSGIDPKRTDKMLSRVGFKTYGGNYVARLG